LGEADIEFDIGGRISGATVLVTPDVSELMLGIDWLSDRRGVWDFNNRVLQMDGLTVPLHTQKNRFDVPTFVRTGRCCHSS